MDGDSWADANGSTVSTAAILIRCKELKMEMELLEEKRANMTIWQIQYETSSVLICLRPDLRGADSDATQFPPPFSSFIVGALQRNGIQIHKSASRKKFVYFKTHNSQYKLALSNMLPDHYFFTGSPSWLGC